MKVDCFTPAECVDADIETFCRMVEMGGEVDTTGLRDLVMRARRLVFARLEGATVGVAAIKQPRAGYRTGVFAKAGVSSPDEYPEEFGWAFVPPEHRSKGVSGLLIEGALRGADRGLFATSWVDNERIHRGLRRFGFQVAGHPYESREPNRMLWLFLRPAVSRQVRDLPAAHVRG